MCTCESKPTIQPHLFALSGSNVNAVARAIRLKRQDNECAIAKGKGLERHFDAHEDKSWKERWRNSSHLREFDEKEPKRKEERIYKRNRH